MVGGVIELFSVDLSCVAIEIHALCCGGSLRGYTHNITSTHTISTAVGAIRTPDSFV